MWASSRFLLGVCWLAAGFYLEYYVGWQQVSTWSMWAGSRFLPGVCGLAAVSTWSMWAGSRFLPGVCRLAGGFYLEYVGWQLCSRSRKDILQVRIEALSHLAVLDLTHPVHPSNSSLNLKRQSHEIRNNFQWQSMKKA
jgi:hypothetical protein